ncbi:MAG: PAS domain S-box protein [Treponemataceae bacterium]|nr:PAS domain S-box protein [Treponemataceae bacterium]
MDENGSGIDIKYDEDILRLINQLKTEIIERKWAEKKSRDALDYAESIIDSVKHPLVVLDENRKVISANLAFYDLFNLTPGMVLGQQFLRISDGLFNFEEMNRLLSVKPTTEPVIIEIHRNFHLIGRKYLKAAIQGLQYNVKHLNFSFLTIEDITEQKNTEMQLRKALEEKSILVREVHHRVKNNLQILLSLLSLQISTLHDENPEEVLEEARTRIMAIAAVHECISEDVEIDRIPLRESIRRLIEGLDALFDDGVHVSITVPEFFLSINQATIISLVLNEIISDIHKVGFDSDAPHKRILIEGEVCGNEVSITISDNGHVKEVPRRLINRAKPESSLGYILVKNLVEQQLKGSWTTKLHKGITHEIRFNTEVDSTFIAQPLQEI